MTDATPSHLPVEFGVRVPAGDDRERKVCRHCGFIDYDNPRVVVGSVVTHADRYLLCTRAIEPRIGYWTLPAGFLEQGETTEEGTLREAYEEARARIELDALIGIYHIPHVGQVQIFYRARLLDPNVAPGPESRAVELFAWQDIPWDDLAFSSVEWALQRAYEVRDRELFPPFSGRAAGPTADGRGTAG